MLRRGTRWSLILFMILDITVNGNVLRRSTQYSSVGEGLEVCAVLLNNSLIVQCAYWMINKKS